jgi:hypothetical protein
MEVRVGSRLSRPFLVVKKLIFCYIFQVFLHARIAQLDGVRLGWDPVARPERDGARWGREQSQQTLTCDID